jgi:hypothetical protein
MTYRSRSPCVVDPAPCDTPYDAPPVTLMVVCRVATVFGCTVKLTSCVPEPLALAGVTHAAPLVAVHEQPFGAVIVNDAVPPCAGKLPDPGDTV